MATAFCSPTGDSAQNCCVGKGEGAKCSQDWDCRGMMTCDDNKCQGQSGCADFCHQDLAGETINCCVAEALNRHLCATDSDCLGARTCDLSRGGMCTGESGCKEASSKHSGLKVTYDESCICLGIDDTCLFPGGVPCSRFCRYSREGNLASCSLLEGGNLV